MKRTPRDNIDGLPYSLHDMRVTRLRVDGDELAMEFESGFVRTAPPCVNVNGEICFHSVDWDFCYAYVLDFCGNEGSFTGRKQPLAGFAAENHGLSFEIIDETYGCNKSRFAGWLSSGDGFKECVIEIYHLGSMEYLTEE